MFGKKVSVMDSLLAQYKDKTEEELKEITVENGYTEEALANHKFTTGFNFEGYEIVEYLGLVSGEAVIGTGYLSDLKMSLGILFGIRKRFFRN